MPSFNIKLHKLHLLKRFLVFFSYIFFYFYVIPTFYHVYCFVIFVTKNNVKNKVKKIVFEHNLLKNIWNLNLLFLRGALAYYFPSNRYNYNRRLEKKTLNCVFVASIYLCIPVICNWNFKYIWVGIACVVRGIQTAVS